MVPLLQRVTFGKAPKVTKNALPHHSAPRLGSVCPHSGIAPWAAAKGHPWPSAAIPASMPGCPLRNACVRPAWFNGALRSRSKAKQSKAKQERRHVQYLWGCATAIASKLAPTLDLQQPQNSCTPQTHCGSGLAREEASTSNIFIDCDIAFASKPAPRGETRSTKNQVGYQAASLGF